MKYLIFDIRAVVDPDDAEILDTADTLEEAESVAKLRKPCVIWNLETNALERVVCDDVMARRVRNVQHVLRRKAGELAK